MVNMTRRIEKTANTKKRLDWKAEADMQTAKRKGEARKSERQSKRMNWEEAE